MRELISSLQQAIKQNTLDSRRINDAIGQLQALGHKAYDAHKFPALPANTAEFSGDIGDTPQNLAEALLWKMGKWNTYKIFVENFNDLDREVSSDGGVVFSAFARYLRDPDAPIYDQHAMRAIWALGSLDATEEEKCRKFLFTGSGGWRQTGTGDNDASCYRLFVKHVNAICDTNQVTHAALDKLLMPLGQALKARTGNANVSDRQAFVELCWPS